MEESTAVSGRGAHEVRFNMTGNGFSAGIRFAEATAGHGVRSACSAASRQHSSGGREPIGRYGVCGCGLQAHPMHATRGSAMGTPREFLDHARDCVRIAQNLKNSDDRKLLADMAQAWVRIANRAELESTLLPDRSKTETGPLN